MKQNYDVLILGAGPAGLTAAIYCRRYNLKTIVIGKSIGGTTNLAGRVENWPGFIGPGKELMQKFKEQAEKFGAEIVKEEISKVRKEKKEFIVELRNRRIYGKALIIALGTENRKLNIPGEKEFLGKGVSYCADCDGNFFKNKIVAVIGGADSSAKAALELAEICKKVYIIYRREELRCEPISFKKIKEKKNIEIIYHSNPKEILGKGFVEKIKIQKQEPNKQDREITLKVDGIFVETGATPSTEVVEALKLKFDCGYIETDANARTNVPGVFAAGDISNNNLKQIITAAGEGAIAAKSAFNFLRKKT